MVRPVEAKEEAPKKGGQTKNKGARVGKARKPAPPPQQPGKATKALLVPVGPMGGQRLKAEGTAQQMPRPTGKPKLVLRVKNLWSPRVRMVWLPQPKRRQGTRSLKRPLPRGPGKD